MLGPIAYVGLIALIVGATYLITRAHRRRQRRLAAARRPKTELDRLIADALAYDQYQTNLRDQSERDMWERGLK